MKMLAINGGQKIRKRLFPKCNNIGKEEKEAIAKVIDSGLLSGYRGNWTEAFFGGPEVRSLEKQFAEKFHVHHAIACNSCTSALFIACATIEYENVQTIVTPWSMSCSASMPMAWKSIPIFADIEKDYFCIDPESIRKLIHRDTKAIVAVDLFGQPYDREKINEIVEEFSLFLIEDAAQAIGAMHKNEYAGTLGDIGVFSFTQGKILFAGEGGMIVTNNDQLAMKCRLLRNHAESVINDMPESSSRLRSVNSSLYGFNLRMTEIQATIIKCQLKKLNNILFMRRKNVQRLNKIFSQIPAIEILPVRRYCTHSYYVHPFKWHKEKSNGLHRNKFINAVIAELMPEEGRIDKTMLGNGYIKPLNQFPFFKYIYKVFPISEFQKIELPIVNELYNKTLCTNMYHGLPLEEEDFLDIEKAFMKVWENKSEL